MTEKRFERVYGDVEVVCIDHEKNEFIDYMDYDKFVDSLNELYEENEQLKQRVEQLENHIINKLTIICGDKKIK